MTTSWLRTTFRSSMEIETLNRYQVEALRTAAQHSTADLTLAVHGLGIAGEAGEVADYLKKVVGHSHELDTLKVAKEIGDVLWYVALLADDIGLTLAEVATMNIEKLRARYPDGFKVSDSFHNG